jgi:hypothetical protein
MFRSVLALVLFAATAAHADPIVRTLAVGTGVADRALTGAADRFPADVGRLYAHLTLANDGAPAPVTVVWIRAGEEVHRIDVTAGAAPRWRTWAHKRVDAGEWRVEARDAAGAVLAGVNFTVAAAAPGA